jgi:general secretion pathway protein G
MAVNGFTRRTDSISIVDCRGMAIVRIMVTLAIIAIVSTVALPISRDHLDSTHVTQAIADIGAIEIAISRYRAQNRGELPGRLTDLKLNIEQWQDPWGNAYAYINLEANAPVHRARTGYDGSIVNRDFDLYSMGKDGRSVSAFNSPVARDDIVRGLNGSYYGTAADYPKAPN